MVTNPSSYAHFIDTASITILALFLSTCLVQPSVMAAPATETETETEADLTLSSESLNSTAPESDANCSRCSGVPELQCSYGYIDVCPYSPYWYACTAITGTKTYTNYLYQCDIYCECVGSGY